MRLLSGIAVVASSAILHARAFRTKVGSLSHPVDGPDPMSSFDAIWHVALRPCLEGKADLRKRENLREEIAPMDAIKLPEFARKAWELDFELHILSPKEQDAWLAFGQQWSETFKRGLLTYFNGTSDSERRTLKEERFNDLLNEMEFQHQFFYTKAKEECHAENRRKHEDDIQPLQVELQQGCQGSCSKISDGCAEPEESQCPEGTKCICLYQQDKIKALKVSAATYMSFWLFNTIVFWGHGGYALPGPMEASVAAAFLFATETVGCQCRPLQCHWSKEENGCTVETQDLDAEIEWASKFPTGLKTPAPWGKNPHISQLPFPGFKCEPEDAYNMWGRKTAEPTCNPVPCTPFEYGHTPSQETRAGTVTGKVGKMDGGVYNCWSLTSDKATPPNVAAAIPSYALPPDARNAVYSEIMLEKDPRERHTMEK